VSAVAIVPRALDLGAAGDGGRCLGLLSQTAVSGGATAAVESSRYALGASGHPPRDARAERRLAFAAVPKLTTSRDFE